MAGGQTHPIAHLYKLEPPPIERMVLEKAPIERAAQSYTVTRAAHRTLSLLSERQNSGSGDFFWLTDPPGAGKTHFLTYLLALRQRLAKAAQEDGRELVLAFDYSEPGSAAQLNGHILDALAKELGGGDRRGIPLWRRMGADAAMEIAIGEARRVGVRAVTMAIDFGLDQPPASAANLVRIARGGSRPSFTIIGASRGTPAPDAVVAEVGPADLTEQLVIAVGRARRLDPRWTTMAHLYDGIDIAPFASEEIFPFHPDTLRALASLSEPAATIAALARMARDVLDAHDDAASLIYPYHLSEAPELKRIIADRLGTDGRASLRQAIAALQSMPRASRQIAEQVVRTLVLAHLCGEAPALENGELWKRLPATRVAPTGHAADAARERGSLLQELATHSNGAIAASPAGAAFVRLRGSSPGVEEFNRALPLLMLFDFAVAPVHDGVELTAAVARLDRSLADLIEQGDSVIQTLNRFAQVSGAQLEPRVKDSVNAFVELANQGASGLLKQGADEKQLSAAQAMAAAYRETVAAAAAVPALLAMKEYLAQSRLEPEQVDRLAQPELAALAAERHLLEAELGPRAPYSKARDSIQARFEKFKWTYIEHYRDAHERWRSEMAKAAALALDADRCLQALLRLDSIAALGAPLGGQFSAPLRDARGAVRICGFEGRFSPFAAAICPNCEYVLGSPPPGPVLTGLMESIARALTEKLTMLSRGAIARLIRRYDRAHRLDGFLKITQAAQTQALAAVLDDQLTAYLARLLQEGNDRPSRSRTGR